jgi:hypothetical protein
MDVLHFADENYNSQLYFHPELEKQRNVIHCAAILHDMCDKKYLDEEKGMEEIEYFLHDKINPEELFYTKKIIESMSYSTVKKNGYPYLGEYELAYHIVREADLLSAYDIDRCIMYRMYNNSDKNITYSEALLEAMDLFDYRVFKMRNDKLFVTNYAKRESLKLHKKAQKDVVSLSDILKK